jgi:hypothetical protein
MTPLTSSRWWREATSGTTPPNRSWNAAWDEITLESTRGPSMTAAQVSSQDVSSANINPAISSAPARSHLQD